MTGIRISFILPALLIAATAANTAHAQFGGGGGFGSFVEQVTGNERLIDSGQGVMVTWSENKDELRGFSDTKGEWTLLKIEPQKQVVPVVGGVVAAVKLSDGMAAYSGETGTWDVVKLPADSDAQAVVNGNRVQFRDSDHLYTFAASTGRWTSPTDERLQRATETIRLPTMIRGNQANALRQAFDKASVVVDRFMLSGSPDGPLLVVDTRKSDVERVREIVAQFIADDPTHGGQPQNAPVPADAVTRDLKLQHVTPLQVFPRVEADLNGPGMWLYVVDAFTFRVTGTPEALDRLEQKAKELDTAENAAAWAKLPAQGREVLNSGVFSFEEMPGVDDSQLFNNTPYVAGPGPGLFPGVGQPVVDPAEQQALDLARTLRDAGKPTDEQQAELRNLVTQSLEARFQQQANQVQQLTEKLEKVRSALEQRQQNKDRIIQRRVEELLDPSVDWNSLTSRSAPVNVARTGTPIGLAGPVKIPVETPAGVSSDLLGSGGPADDPFRSDGNVSSGIRPRDELYAELKKQQSRATGIRDSILSNLRRIEADESEYNIEAARTAVAQLRTRLAEQLTEWKQVWRDYESGIRLLDLEVMGRRAMLSADQDYAGRLQRAAEKHLVSPSQARKVEDRVSVSQVQVQRAEEHLRAYKSLAEVAPHLNPHTFDVSQVLETESGRNVPDSDGASAFDRARSPSRGSRETPIQNAGQGLTGLDPELIADMRSRLQGPQGEVARLAKSFPAGAKLVRLLKKAVTEWTEDEKAGLQDLARASFVRMEVPEGDELTEEWRKRQFERYMSASVIIEHALLLKENKTAWDRAWADYQSRVRLLELDVREAKVVLQASEAELQKLLDANEKSKALGETAVFPDVEVGRTRNAVDLAKIAVQRATERRQQLTDIVEKQPELDPTKFTMPEGVEDAIPAPGDF